jgi:cytoskeleton protein RodZ
MSELGERLRQARESKGISLAQASTDTRILRQSLIALEDGAFQRLPGDVVTRGFIRNYGQYLDLPIEELIDMYRRERGASDKIRVVATSSAPRARIYTVPSFLGVFFVTIALVGLAYVALNALGRVGDDPQVAAAPTVENAVVPSPTSLPTVSTVTAEPTLSPSPRPMPTSASVAGFGFTPTPTATPAAPIVVEVRIENDSAPSWLRVRADDVTVYEQIMQPGEIEIFEARREVYVRSGNPSAVRISVNGLNQGVLGNSATPVDWYWPPR